MLIRKLAVNGDSPVKSNRGELVEQFSRRNCSTQLSNMMGLGIEDSGSDPNTEVGGTATANAEVGAEEVLDIGDVEVELVNNNI